MTGCTIDRSVRKRDILTPMKDFVITFGKIRDLGGTETDGWLVLDNKAHTRAVVAQVFNDDSGKALIQAMIDAGATRA